MKKVVSARPVRNGLHAADVDRADTIFLIKYAVPGTLSPEPGTPSMLSPEPPDCIGDDARCCFACSFTPLPSNGSKRCDAGATAHGHHHVSVAGVESSDALTRETACRPK